MIEKCRAWSGSKLFDTLMVMMVFLKDFFEKVNMVNLKKKNIPQMTKKHAKLPSMQSFKT